MTRFPEESQGEKESAHPADVLGKKIGAEGGEAGKGTGLAQLASEDFSLLAAMGGPRGIAEAIVPSLLFLIAYIVTEDMGPAIWAGVGSAAVLLIIRLVQRIDLTPALGGAFAVAVSAIWAWRTGVASNWFIWGIIANGAYLAALLVSIAARWPLIGVIVAALRGQGQEWRSQPDLRRRYYLATWLWCGLFALRLIVKLPLYLADNVRVLGIASLAMGPFLFAIVAWMTWMICRKPSDTIEV